MHGIPDPILVDEKKLDLSSIEAAGKKFRQFSRLTVSLMDSTSVHKLQHHPKRQLYDIVAVRCLDESILNTMSRKGELFDLITMDCKVLDGHYPWIYKQKLIQACITDGIMFELCYGEALFDNEMRRQFLINGRALNTIANNSRGIILSSGAQSAIALRGPYDAANMCTLFGMQPKEGKKLLSDNCCKLLLRSQSRQTIKGAVHITEVENTPVPPHINRNDHLTALATIPEFYEQMKTSSVDSNSGTQLDSRAYRWMWNIRKFLRLQPGPQPIVWKIPDVQLQIPSDLWSKLNHKQVQNLQNFQRELDVLQRIYTHVPSQLSETQWKTIAEMNACRERFETLKFFRKLQRKRSREQEERAERQKLRLAENSEVESQDVDQSIAYFNSQTYIFWFHWQLEKNQRDQVDMRLYHAHRLRDCPSIVVDCRFLPQHTHRGRNLTFLQLAYLVAANRKRLNPWLLTFANFDDEIESNRIGLKKHLRFAESDTLALELTSKSYLQLYDRDRLIYLSPHATETLTTEEATDEQTIFIIGGIVDRITEPNIHPQASKVTADEEKVKCRKLPLKENVDWRAGRTLLTLTSVMEIVQDVYDTQGDWKYAIQRSIPVRNKITMKEKNANVKLFNDNQRQYEREILRIVRENVCYE
ncbi:TRNA (Guanine-N(1)-)-methyltransferase [Aphelenchoides besseyi]|nr:TRNA (Guanine-N(1)-)-methyltransferase [Aphelenchoides besseyi]